jgi:hypothetical protein
VCNHYKSSGEWRTRTGEFSELRIPQPVILVDDQMAAGLDPGNAVSAFLQPSPVGSFVVEPVRAPA